MSEDDRNIKIRPLSARQIKLLIGAAGVFLLLGIAANLWPFFQLYKVKLNMGYYAETMSLPPTDGFVDYQIADYTLRIPSSYHFTVYRMRGNRWFKDMPVQKVDGGIIVDAFLPNFSPYGPEVHALYVNKNYKEFWARRVMVALSKSESKVVSPEQWIKGYGDEVHPEETIYGLMGFTDKMKHPNSRRRFFIPVEGRELNYKMICATTCDVTAVYKEYPNLIFTYQFSLDHLSDWEMINKNVKALISRFVLSNFSSSVKE